MAFLANTRKGLICLPKSQSRIYVVSNTGFTYVRREFPDDGVEDKAMDMLIKQSAYDNGLRRSQVIDVLAIELRDRLLRMRGLVPPES